MVALRRLMPLAWLGVVSCDGRRFDELTTSRLPVNILRREDDGSLYPDAIIVGQIIDVARAADGRVTAVCEFWEPIDPTLVLGMDGWTADVRDGRADGGDGAVGGVVHLAGDVEGIVMAGRGAGKLRMRREETGWYTIVRDGVRWHIVGRSGTLADQMFRKAWVVASQAASASVLGKRVVVAEFDHIVDAREWLRDRLKRSA